MIKVNDSGSMINESSNRNKFSFGSSSTGSKGNNSNRNKIHSSSNRNIINDSSNPNKIIDISSIDRENVSSNMNKINDSSNVEHSKDERKSDISNINKRRLMALLLMLAYFLYLIVGGLIFHAIEYPGYKKHRKESKYAGLEWLENHKCVSYEELRALVTRVAKELQYGDISFSNESTAPNWDVPSSIFFASTVLTTIGYGHIAPATGTGKIFCVFYALFGIPLTGMMLAAIGERITSSISRIQKHNLCIENPRIGAAIQCLVLFGGGLVIFITLPAIIFWKIEGWTYWEAWYYCFITLSTIGFGDFVVGIKADKTYRQWYRLLTALWILIGLAWLACVIASMTEVLKTRIEHRLKISDSSNQIEDEKHSIEDRSTFKKLQNDGDLSHNNTNIPMVTEKEESL